MRSTRWSRRRRISPPASSHSAARTACATAFDRGRPGLPHQLAHLLGGALRLDHAALHAILLPHVVAHLRATRPELIAELERAIQRAPLDDYLTSVLARAGAPTTLAALGATAESVAAALATRPELPAAIAMRATTPSRS